MNNKKIEKNEKKIETKAKRFRFLYETGIQWYVLIGMASLVVFYSSFSERGGILAPILIVIFSVPGLLLRWSSSPWLFMFFSTFALIDPDYSRFLSRLFSDDFFRKHDAEHSRLDFELGDLLISFSALTYLIAQFRVQSILTVIFPKEGRRDPQGELTLEPLLRPSDQVDKNEWIDLLISTGFATMFGTMVWFIILYMEKSALWHRYLNLNPVNGKLAIAILSIGIGLFLTQLWSLLRLSSDQDKDSARFFLLDLFWLETAREHERLARWQQWYRNRRNKHQS